MFFFPRDGSVLVSGRDPPTNKYELLKFESCDPISASLPFQIALKTFTITENNGFNY